MYSTCIHCHAALGANESIEHFPVGQRLAFDEAKGRLMAEEIARVSDDMFLPASVLDRFRKLGGSA